MPKRVDVRQENIPRRAADRIAAQDRLVVQLRQNTRITPGDVGSIPIESASFDGPMSLGYRKSSLEDERVRIPRHQTTGEYPARLLSLSALKGPIECRLPSAPCADVAQR